MFRYFYCLLLIGVMTASYGMAMPAQVMIIRHAEKPPEGTQLSSKGKERAAALAAFFIGNPGLTRFGTPVAIYAAGIKDENSSRRSIQTVTPLAAVLRLKVIDTFKHNGFRQMVEEIKANPQYDKKMVLICWEHHLIPIIAKAFGVKNAPTKWSGTVFDRLWVLNFQSDGSIVLNCSQRLMFQDSPN